MNAVLDSSQEDLRIMNSKRLVVFAASRQWADAEKVTDVGDLGNSVVGVCSEERRRKCREVPDAEACTLVGVDW